MPRPLEISVPRVVSAEFSAQAMEASSLPPPVKIEVAFAGRSNVGKSSLMNVLLDRKNLVRTSSTPGCTRGVNVFDLRLSDGTEAAFVDLPGYGYAKRSKAERSHWGDLVEHYLLARATLRAVVLLVDVRRGVEDDDADLLELCASPARVARRPLETIVVATKLDKISASAQKPALLRARAAAGKGVIGFSIKDRTSRDALWREILGACKS